MPQAEPLSAPPGEARSFALAKPRRAKGASSPGVPPAPIDYPESDDEPMGESFLHIAVSLEVFGILVAHFAKRPDVCLGCDNFIYYEEGNPRAVVVPDVFVVFGVPKRTDRRVFKVWEEGAKPEWVLEVTSRKIRKEDEGKKKDLYERLGVTEYWQFDPTGDYLRPKLKGRVLADGRYRELELERRDGGLCRHSEVLGLDLRLEDERLRFFDFKRGEYLLSFEEQRGALMEQQEALIEQFKALRATTAERDAALARIAELERQLRSDR